ncbi:MAG: glucosamine-6-phosphate isomerase [Candidatus Marinimicrobia bacterium]|nr:glucosamine-6-phosphate isomerase [Candidatus Neomarinimicrobiota bacterium]
MKIYSNVEKAFLDQSDFARQTTIIPYIIVENFPCLGFLTSLRFLEWVCQNPEGVISLPTGKTPEYFIKWTKYLLENWSDIKLEKLRRKNGFDMIEKPNLAGLQFIQIDEFYPIDPDQYNSFYNYVQRFYINGFGLDPRRGKFINCDEIPCVKKKTLVEIFPDQKVDLSLRYREATSFLEEEQQKTIFMVDQWCTEYENAIREKGGIGFFLGGLGPDGHIAFNVRGSDHNSTTRLMETNFETQAAAATDLGGIEVSRNRLVITIGLATIIAKENCTAIIVAAGEAKAAIVQESLEKIENIQYPATALQRLAGSRFYLTQGAASKLNDVVEHRLKNELWTNEKTEMAVVSLCQKLNKFGHRLTVQDLKNDFAGSFIPEIDDKTVQNVIDSIKQKLEKVLNAHDGETFLHTGPHHDDIMLGYLPHIIHLVRSPRNKNYFANMTSGFTSVTNHYVIQILEETATLLNNDRIEMIDYPNFFEKGFNLKQDKDVYHYLDRIAEGNVQGQKRGLSHRIIRDLVEIYSIKSKSELNEKIIKIISYLNACYDGEKNPQDIQKLKGMIREFEEELVWAHYGVQAKDVNHLRLGFYTGDIFTEIPEQSRDVEPILKLLKKIKPTVITLALDPEGSGPDTHYKVLQAIAEAVRLWGEETDVSHLKIWGYRNVWYRFNPAEADIIVPVSLNSMAMLRDTFMNCYLSQKDASFPSYEFDGPFCDLTQKIWVEQHKQIALVLGRDFWYQNDHPRLRATHGLVFLKELDVEQFLNEARRLEKSMEGQINF